MVVRREKKRRRGERTYHGRHGYPRGAGSKGGRGNAGLHKHRWLWTIKYKPDHFGKEGFTSRFKKYKWQIPKIINVGFLDEMAEFLVKEGKAKKEGGKIVINLKEFSIDKLLGSGKVTKALIIEGIREFSARAKEKIEAAGGEIRVA